MACGVWREEMSDGFLLRALAVADADELVIYPDSAVLRKQLPLFLGAAVTPNSLACCCYSFALTNDTGSRLYVYVLKEGSVSFCAITAQEQQTPLFALLASLIQLAAADASAGLLERAVQLLCDALLPPSPGTALRIVLPTLGGSCRLECQLGANAPAGQLPAADELLFDAISALGLSQALEVWGALLLERAVLLLSDCVPLLSATAHG